MSSIAERVRDSIPAGMNQQMLASQVEMTPDAFSRALNGKRHFSALELGDLARVLDLNLNWLITGERDPFEVTLAARHRWDGSQQHSTQTDMDFIAMVRKVYEAASDGDDLGAGVVDLPEDPATVRALLPAGDITTLGERIQAGLGIDVIRDPNLHTDYSVHIGLRPVILLKAIPQWFRVNWSLVHELGHIALGHRTDRPDRTTEWPANQFAAEFLLPERLMRATRWDTMSSRDLALFLWKQGVSTEALRKRLDTLQLQPSAVVDSNLNRGTVTVLRRHLEAFSDAPFSEPIEQRESQTSSRRFPARLITALAQRVEAGLADPLLLAWVRGVGVDELEEQWPEDNAPPSPSDLDVDEWFDLLEAP
ncbi:hypothetical protein GCM10027418_22820 [Mariniluteicoccus endophyticus]